MKELFPLKGIVTVLNTPFKQDDAIDFEALKNNTREAIRAGVSGFLVPTMASEVYKLSEIERIKLVETVLNEVNAKVPVIAGAEAILFGLAGFQPRYNGQLYINPHHVCNGDIKIAGFRFRNNIFDVKLSESKMKVIRNGTVLYDGKPKLIRIL